MDKKIKIADGTKGMIGVYKFTKAFIETAEQMALNDRIVKLREAGKDYLSLVRRLNEICRTETLIVHNVVPTVAKTMIANNLCNAVPDNTMLINKAELGTGQTAPAAGDTALQTPAYRNTVASITNFANIGYITAFFSATECSAHYYEAGIYSDGTATLGDGIIVSHVAIDIDKSLTESLTLDWTLTIS